MTTRQLIIEVEPVNALRPDWSRINRLIARGFTRLYQLDSSSHIICAKPWITQRRAMQLLSTNGHGGVR